MNPMRPKQFKNLKAFVRLQKFSMAICLGLAASGIAVNTLAQNQPQQPSLAEGILVSVNNDIISSYDLKQRMQLLMVTSEVQVTEENFAVIQQQALRSLIDERLKLQELIHWKVEVSDQEIDEQIAQMASQSGMTSEQLLSELKKIGVESPTIRSQIKADIGWSMLVGGRFRSNAKVGKDQIDATMDKIIEDSQKPQFEVAEIFLDPTIVGSQEAALQGANQLYNQLIAKAAPFQKVAQQFSQAPSAANGGMAGFLVSGEMDPIVEATLTQMQPNQISRPVVARDGVYIFYLISKTDGNADLAMRLIDISIPLPNAVEGNAQTQAQNLVMAVKTTDVCGIGRVNTRGDIVISDLGNVNLSDLQPTYSTSLKPLRVGAGSEVIKTSNGIHRLVVCDRLLVGDDAPTRDSVERSLVNRRLGMLGKRYLRDIRNAATIEYHY